MSFLIPSNHLFTGLPLCLSPCTITIECYVWKSLRAHSPNMSIILQRFFQWRYISNPAFPWWWCFWFCLTGLHPIFSLDGPFRKLTVSFGHRFSLSRFLIHILVLESMGVWYSWIFAPIVIAFDAQVSLMFWNAPSALPILYLMSSVQDPFVRYFLLGIWIHLLVSV